MQTRIHNRTGLTVITSMHVSSPCIAIGDSPVEMPTAAWEHTLACGPGLRSLVGEGPGTIEVSEVGAEQSEPMTGGTESPPVLTETKPDPVVEFLTGGLAPIDPVLDALTVAARPAFVPKGKRR